MGSSTTKADLNGQQQGLLEVDQPSSTEPEQHSTEQWKDEASHDPPDREEFVEEPVVCTGFVNVTGTGSVRRTDATDEADRVLRNLPNSGELPRESIREASTNHDGSEAKQMMGELAASQVECNSEWNYALQVAESIIEEVKPWYLAARKTIDEANATIDVVSKEYVVRLGSWRSLCEFRHLPALFSIVFYSLVILVGGSAETICGMVYASVAWPDFVEIGFDWFSKELIALALTIGFVIGPFVLLKFIPFSQDAVGADRFFKRFRFGAALLILTSPVTFSWVLGVAKDFPPGMTDPPWNPGMTGYVCCAMFLLAFTTTAAACFLKSAVDSLYVLKRIEIPQRAVAQTELGLANEALASCVALIKRAERVIQGAEAAKRNLELGCTAALQADQAALEARKVQAFVLPSRN